MRARLVTLAAVLTVACDPPPPVKTSSGEIIKSVAFEESFPLSSDVKEVTLRGDRLRSAVALMDKHGVFDVKGEHRATGVLDKSTLTIVITSASGAERRASFRSCANDAVCAFFTEAAAQGIVEHKPLVCRDSTPCEAPQ